MELKLETMAEYIKVDIHLQHRHPSHLGVAVILFLVNICVHSVRFGFGLLSVSS